MVKTMTTKNTTTKTTKKKVFETTIKEQWVAFVAFILSIIMIRISVVQDAIIAMLSVLGLQQRYQSPPLTVYCWIAHYPLQIIGLELAKTTLLLANKQREGGSSPTTTTTKSSTIVCALGVMFVINYVQGWIILMSHSVAGGYNRELETSLDGLGAILLRITVFSMGIFGKFTNLSNITTTTNDNSTTTKHDQAGGGAAAGDSIRWLILFPLIVYGVITQRITFENMNGRILSTASLLAIFSTSDLHVVTKFGYLMSCFTTILFPGDFVQSNVTHSLAATYLNVSVAVMLLGMKLKNGISFYDIIRTSTLIMSYNNNNNNNEEKGQ